MSKNYPNDPRIDCKSPSNLVELIEKDLDFEEELEKIEGSFKQDDLLNIFFFCRIYLIFIKNFFLKK